MRQGAPCWLIRGMPPRHTVGMPRLAIRGMPPRHTVGICRPCAIRGMPPRHAVGMPPLAINADLEIRRMPSRHFSACRLPHPSDAVSASGVPRGSSEARSRRPTSCASSRARRGPSLRVQARRVADSREPAPRTWLQSQQKTAPTKSEMFCRLPQGTCLGASKFVLLILALF